MAQHQAYYDQLFANHFSEDEVPDLLQTTHTPLAESQRKVGSQANRLDGPFLDLSISLSPREADELQRQSILSLKPYVQTKGDVSQADYGELVPKIERTLLRSVWSTEHSTAQVYSGTQVKKPSAGPKWFNMQKTNLTPELKRDLQVLGMRSVLDPKRHYKSERGKPKPPEFSDVGTIIAGPTEYYSSRLLNRERHNTLLQDILMGEARSKSFTKKYHETQVKAISGKKSHYKSVKQNRLRKHT